MQNSPLLQNSGPFFWGNPPVNLGATQYIDALQRAEFFQLLQIKPDNLLWHTLLELHTTTAQAVNVPAGYGATYNAGLRGGGVASSAWWT